MKQFKTKLEKFDGPIFSEVVLSIEQRVKARQKIQLENGSSAGLFNDRGSVLKDGDFLQAESGETIVIKAANESVSTLYTDDALSLSRACYHLGNRHVALQINKQFVRYLHDHVLDDMLVGLGLKPVVELAPFEPEPGAYERNQSKSAHDGGHHSHA